MWKELNSSSNAKFGVLRNFRYFFRSFKLDDDVWRLGRISLNWIDEEKRHRNRTDMFLACSNVISVEKICKIEDTEMLHMSNKI